jgi:tRNA-uridine 2-sulfurtransferase
MSHAVKKVFVGMSGGVDSSVAALLLQKDGYDVTGVFIKVWEPEFLPCTWREERREAQRVAAYLGIPLITLDLAKEYKEGVVDYMISEYRAGRTPNPDVMCNREVKFGAFLNFALKEGATHIATGHYARIEEQGGVYQLKESIDKEKDQSYFLWTLGQKELAHTLFPIGHLTKSDVRKIAAGHNLPNAAKKDSQGICFLGAVDMTTFLKEFIPSVPGSVLNEKSEVIGSHDGAVYYTIGERHGFTLTERKKGDNEPLFVVAKNIQQNTITVAPRSASTTQTTHATSRFLIHALHTVSGGSLAGGKLSVRLRYHQNPIPATINEDEIVLKDSSDGISPGQSAVFYDGEECVGGAVIKEVFSQS